MNFTKLRKNSKYQNTKISELQSKERILEHQLDSLNNNIQDLAKVQNNDRLSFQN